MKWLAAAGLAFLLGGTAHAQTIVEDRFSGPLERTIFAPKESSRAQWAPIPAVGDVRIGYTLVDLEDATVAADDAFLRQTVRASLEYLSAISGGRFHATPVFLGHKSAPFSLAQACDAELMMRIAAYVDSDTRGLDSLDARMYLLPQMGSCPFSGLGTLEGNPTLPLNYRDMVPNQSFILIPSSELIMIHELGHNLGLSHASSPQDEYGDMSSMMGGFEPPYWVHELRDLNAAERHRLGWDASIEFGTRRGGERTLHAAEASEGPQRIVFPGDDGVVVLSYRDGSERRLIDGTPVPLAPFDAGVNVHLIPAMDARKTVLLGVLEDGIESEYRLSSRATLKVRQLWHSNDEVSLTYSLDLQPGDESSLSGNCSDGIDNDGDGVMDANEGPACPIEWKGISAPSRVVAGRDYTVECATNAGPADMGVLLKGTQEYSQERTPQGYRATIRAPSCGKQQYVLCGSDDPTLFFTNQPEALVDIVCEKGETCVEGACMHLDLARRLESRK